MQELEYFTGGAALVISVGGLTWLPHRRGSDRGTKKRGEERRLRLSPGQMAEAGEDRRPAACVCALHHGGGQALQSLRPSNRRPRLAAGSPSRCLPEELFQPSTCSSSDPFITDVPKETTWMKFTLNLSESSIPVMLNQDVTAESLCRRFIVFCHDQTPVQLCSEVQDCRALTVRPDWPSRDSLSVDFRDPTAQWSPGPGPGSGEEPGEAGATQNGNTPSPRGLLRSPQDGGPPGASGSAAKLRKSVSFDDDVMVYLFDQERPTLDLQSEPCTSPSSNYSCSLPGFTVNDNGLEWEDDFSALEQSRHVRCAGPPRRRRSLSPPTRSGAALQTPERRCPAQRCLFLTYVTETDLEL
ncbi:class A basic helix-loop-helix protein 15 isoform X1 [Salarias fasciatus]|uniref:class A basic helix-loop-helix protein 15 isoform X1 n=1 Tax=Salarias fasciatus TaxID=181472 RepID=UPI001176B8FD|nr:class A basic helix-loop-helix protein 15 isoform X1 [Salarias fasciatus]